jgi:hypothetical protein
MRRLSARGPWLVAVVVVALAYSAGHFYYSGVVFPLEQPNLSKFEEEATVLWRHIEYGEPLRAKPVQWGPVFFMVMDPLLRSTGGFNQTLARWLYALQIICLAFAFWLTCATLKPLAAASDRDKWPLVVAGLAVVWLNFSPLLMVLAVKTVETWEVLLLGWPSVVGFAVAAAGLIKALPLVIFYYLLIKDRRAFAYGCLAIGLFLLAGFALYGPDEGPWYLPRLARWSIGNSYLLNWHENLSLKAAILKLFGHLELPHVGQIPHNGPVGYVVETTPLQLRAATLIGDAGFIAGFGWLTWVWFRAAKDRSIDRLVWEWSVLLVAMLILSPHTAFEYLTLALSAISYAFVRAVTTTLPAEHRVTTRLWLAASMCLLGVLLTRGMLNRLTFVTALNRWTGYTHLTPSEAYQYYCFPLAGLILLAVALLQLEPAARAGARRLSWTVDHSAA